MNLTSLYYQITMSLTQFYGWIIGIVVPLLFQFIMRLLNILKDYRMPYMINYIIRLHIESSVGRIKFNRDNFHHVISFSRSKEKYDYRVKILQYYLYLGPDLLNKIVNFLAVGIRIQCKNNCFLKPVNDEENFIEGYGSFDDGIVILLRSFPKADGARRESTLNIEPRKAGPTTFPLELEASFIPKPKKCRKILKIILKILCLFGLVNIKVEPTYSKIEISYVRDTETK